MGFIFYFVNATQIIKQNESDFRFVLFSHLFKGSALTGRISQSSDSIIRLCPCGVDGFVQSWRFPYREDQDHVHGTTDKLLVKKLAMAKSVFPSRIWSL